jgi:hypothetical protein
MFGKPLSWMDLNRSSLIENAEFSSNLTNNIQTLRFFLVGLVLHSSYNFSV